MGIDREWSPWETIQSEHVHMEVMYGHALGQRGDWFQGLFTF